MSDKELDNLFNKKLEGFQASPSPEAWKNIEAGIRPGGINWKFYITIAASLLLVGVITVLMILPTQESELFTATEEGLSTEQTSPETEELAAVIEGPSELQPEIIEEKSAQEQKLAADQRPVTEPTRDKLIEKNPTSMAVSAKEVKLPLLANNTDTTLEEKVENEQQAIAAKAMTSLETVQPLEETTISLAATPVVFTGEKVAIATTEPAPEESSRGFSFKKVVELARDFKTDNDSWSSLREAKNELLTLGRKKNDNSDD